MGKKHVKVQWAVALGAAGAWFGQHCGAGFASGLQEITYFVNAGWVSAFTTLIPMVIIGTAFYFIGEYAREIHATSYKDVATTLYSKNKVVGNIMLVIFDLIVMASVLVSSSSVMAGAGSLLNETFGWDYTFATIVFAALIVVVSMFGARVLAEINLPLSVVLIGGLFIIAVALIGANWGNLEAIFASGETFDAEPVDVVGNVLYYTCMQTGFAGAYIAIAGQFTSSKDSKVMAVTGIIINTGMLLLVSMAVLSGMPGIASEDIPILIMVRECFGSGSVLFTFYSISLFLAYVSTADVVAATSRFGVLVNRKKRYNQVVVDAILAIILLGASLLLAQFGIRALVDVAYRALGLLRGPVYLLGGLVFAPIKLHQIRARRAAEEAAPQVEDATS